MPEARVAGKLPFEEAAGLIDVRLRAAFGDACRSLSLGDIRAAYPRRRFVRGWRTAFDCPDGEVRRIDLLLGPAFPSGYPRTALVDRPPHLEWPHVERDGVLCLLPVGAEVDPEDPVGVAENLMGRSARLIGELLEGRIVDRDFREEFLTYWFYASDVDAPLVRSIIRPGGPSRPLRVWRDRDGSMILAEDADQLGRWLDARLDLTPGRKAHHHQPAALVWLDEPMVPANYPATGSDLLALARAAGGDAVDALEAVAASTTEDGVVLIGAEGRGGPGLVAAITTVAGKAKGTRSGADHPLTKGFRHRPLPGGVATDRMFSAAPLVRATVARADARWIHGRGNDPRTDELLIRRVVVIGCGSLGSSVAARLARAGIGRIDLVDYDQLSWSNVGRHELGADQVGAFKSTAMASRLGRELPHLDVHGHVSTAHGFMLDHDEVMAAADLIVCATASWDAESAVNAWQVERGRSGPVLYGWLEDQALAAHALTVGSSGGCLSCGFDGVGAPALPIIEWPAGRPIVEEPACGNHYQPYGAVELGAAVDLVARAALDALLSKPIATWHSAWLAPAADLGTAGASWSDEVVAQAPEALHGGVRITLGWPDGCPRCRDDRHSGD